MRKSSQLLSSFNQTGWYWLRVTLLVFILDRITKYAAVNLLEAYTPSEVFSFLNWTLSYNKGAAFSFLAKGSGWQVYLLAGLAIGVSAAIVVWLRLISSKQRWLGIALAMILGGALGNLWDRIAYRYVIDFIQFHVSHYYWPTFNLADTVICIGAFMILWDAFRGKR